MDIGTYLDCMHVAERLKDTPRHCFTSGGRRESVAEHTFRIALMAMFIRDEFPDADIDKVIRMCLIHDLGEAFTGDIPAFDKTSAHEERERSLLDEWVRSLPDPVRTEMTELYKEMEERRTTEARLYKALDGLEAVIQHNESDISTWAENEYELNLSYAEDRCEFSPYLAELRRRIREESVEKIRAARGETGK